MSDMSLSRPVLVRCRPGRNFRSFDGYNNANCVLSEIRDPVRTIKRAAPIALAFITVTYLLVNIAYFGAVQKNDILGSGRIVGLVRALFRPVSKR